MILTNFIVKQNTFGTIISIINLIFTIVVFLIYFHQMLYSFIGLITRPRKFADAKVNHKYAYLISAHNEEIVIENLIHSIYAQDYPKELMQVFVVADNCNDKTALLAKKAGAIVYERFDEEKRGKSYALDFLLNKIFREHDNGYEAFFIFDADNLVSKNYTTEMNKVFDAGYKVSTSFRDTKNFENWISAGASMAFYRECLLIHQSRSIFDIGTFVSGTGFFISADLLKETGWVCHTMTEDIEFSLKCSLEGIKIGYCADAVFYDEQPTTLKSSLNQRLRWCKGMHQIFFRDAKKVIKKNFKGFNAESFELCIHVSPIPLITTLWFVIYSISTFINASFLEYSSAEFFKLAIQLFSSLGMTFFGLLVINAFIVILKYHKNIRCPLYKQIFYCFTFPIYMFFYLPLSFMALFKKVQWVKVPHTINRKIDEISS